MRRHKDIFVFMGSYCGSPTWGGSNRAALQAGIALFLKVGIFLAISSTSAFVTLLLSLSLQPLAACSLGRLRAQGISTAGDIPT